MIYYKGGRFDLKMTIKELRKEKHLTQKQASELTGIPLRTFKMYENDAGKIGSIKHSFILNTLAGYNVIDEDHGVLSVQQIEDICASVFENYPVSFCVLFGSYAKGTATDSSDIDLLIASDLSGLKYFGMIEDLRGSLHKKVDALDLKQLDSNPELLKDILMEGMRIYVQR